MSTDSVFQDKNYLRERQYRDSRNLDARAALHRDFSTSVEGWQTWVFDHLELAPGTAVLECGCGPGWLWRENLARIPADCQITLTDLSPGMVAEAESALVEAESALSDRPGFRFQTASIDDLPFDDASFDVVVANHMLYHVPDLDKALAEVCRVLKPHGRFFAATNGANHMRELKELALQLAGDAVNQKWPQLGFRLENGRELLAPYFDDISLAMYEDGLAVTAVEPLMAYLRSMALTQEMQTDHLGGQTAALEQHIAAVIATEGAYHIQKETGLFIARNGRG
ncbi:MAG: class I SAM-dependent methyltransferase [Ardenticatenaceae bacterium]|nr:class I SAM-dependent methyltransferase [Ardenticatenaceae bacterium]